MSVQLKYLDEDYHELGETQMPLFDADRLNNVPDKTSEVLVINAEEQDESKKIMQICIVGNRKKIEMLLNIRGAQNKRSFFDLSQKDTDNKRYLIDMHNGVHKLDN